MVDMSPLTDPSLLEYARFHEIATRPFDINDVLPVADGDLDQSIQDPTDTFNIDLQDVRLSAFSTRERLNISKSGAAFLSSILNPQVPLQDQLDTALSDCDRYHVACTKLGTPSLSTDHEIDMLSFRQSIAMDGIELDLPLEPDCEEDHTSDYIFRLQKQLQLKMEREKLDCTREVLVYLQQIGKMWECSAGEVDDIRMLWMSSRAKVIELDHLTPPLLPMDPSPVPFVPSSPSMQLNLISQPATPMVAEHEEVKRMLHGDVFIPMNESCAIKLKEGDSDGFLLGPRETKGLEADISPETRIRTKEVEYLKIEGPITPPVSSKKGVQESPLSASEIVKGVDFSVLYEKESTEKQPAGLHEMLEESLVEIARAAMLKLGTEANTERLRGVDEPVWCVAPELEPACHNPPWKTDILSPLSSITEVLQLSDQPKRELCNNAGNDKDMRWNPFEEGLADIKTVESPINGDTVPLMFAEEELDLPTRSETLREGTRPPTTALVDSSDEDIGRRSGIEDIAMPVTFQEQSHINEDVRAPKRKKRRGSKTLRVLMEKDPNLQIAKRGRKASGAARNSNTITAPQQFSTSTSLDNFMQIRGQQVKRQKLDTCPYFGGNDASNTENSSDQPPDRSNKATEPDGQASEKPLVQSDATCIEPLPTPVVPTATYSLTLVLSADVLQTHRQLVRNLESVKPAATLIFRDYNAVSNALRSAGDHLGTNREHEADIIISPTTGILLTTCQATTQQYLPGQGPRHQSDKRINSPLRERIFSICARYEQIYVLVSHFTRHTSNKQPTNGTMASVDQKAMSSIASLTSFCASLQKNAAIHVLLVPFSSELLTSWILSLAHKHYVKMPWSKVVEGFPPGGPDDLDMDSTERSQHCEISFENPTAWELFLRRLGLNPFAALAVSTSRGGLCEERSSVPSDTDTALNRQKTSVPEAQLYCPQESMSCFVAMDPDERRRIFGPLLGDRVLSRVETSLEMKW